MTQIKGYVPPSRRPGELGVHSIDHFSLNLPDLAVAEEFYRSFGVDVEARPGQLILRAAGSSHPSGVIAEGPHKGVRYLSFGAFEDDFPRFRDRLEQLRIPRLDPPPGYPSNGLWFRDPDGNLIEIKVGEKTSPSEKPPFSMGSVAGGQRGVTGRASRALIRPHRLAHVAVFTTSVDRAIQFYQQVLGLRLTDRGGDVVAFLHGIHGSDHHMLALALSPAPGFHHASWAVPSINEVGLGAMQMADKGFHKGWGLLRHVLGSNYSHYVRDPWGSYFEYTCDIDYIPATHNWEAGRHPAEDSLYLWGPPLPEDFIVNYEAFGERNQPADTTAA
jgi:catechol 2,3-dioxygenase-like lactoylglutathione lyase family enzyme